MDSTGQLAERNVPDGSHYQGTLLALTFDRSNLQDFYKLLNAAKQEAGLLPKEPIKPRFT